MQCRPDNPSSIPGTHMRWRERTDLPKVVLCHSHVHHGICIPITHVHAHHTYMYIHTAIHFNKLRVMYILIIFVYKVYVDIINILIIIYIMSA